MLLAGLSRRRNTLRQNEITNEITPGDIADLQATINWLSEETLETAWRYPLGKKTFDYFLATHVRVRALIDWLRIEEEETTGRKWL